MPDSNTPWYADGLRFSCTGCGHCCRIEGHVWIDLEEIRAIARHLDLGLQTFARQYRVGRRFSLLDKPNGDCIFWEDGCSIYDSRPRQCRTFPFWNQNLENETAWNETGRECEGIGESRLYQLPEIEALRLGHGATSSESHSDRDRESSNRVAGHGRDQ